MKKSKTIQAGAGDNIIQVIIYIVVGLIGLMTLLPFLYVIAGSFATEKELTERAFFIIPRTISFNAYKYIVQTGEIFNGLKNSLFLTIQQHLPTHYQRKNSREETLY